VTEDAAEALLANDKLILLLFATTNGAAEHRNQQEKRTNRPNIVFRSSVVYSDSQVVHLFSFKLS
jgi:hypothetical protein